MSNEDTITLDVGLLIVDGIVVSGSRTIRRSPSRLSPDAEDRMLYSERTYTFEIPPEHLWCSRCGEVRPQAYFHHDASRKARGGYAYVCKACENPVDRERKRSERRQKATAEGREIRQYNRRQAG